MENATKALLIAAAVLIAIIIVALTLKLLSSANNSGDISQSAADEIKIGTEKSAKTAQDEIIKSTQVNLLNLKRKYESLTVDTNIGNNLDKTKGYLNIGYGNRNGYTSNCQVSNITSDSITVKEPGIGGIAVAVPIPLPDSTKQYKISCDYSGEGKVRAYWSYANSSTGATTRAQLLMTINNEAYTTAGISGSIDITLTPPVKYISGGDSYDYLILMLSSNTSKTKTYSNVVVNKVN